MKDSLGSQAALSLAPSRAAFPSCDHCGTLEEQAGVARAASGAQGSHAAHVSADSSQALGGAFLGSLRLSGKRTAETETDEDSCVLKLL